MKNKIITLLILFSLCFHLQAEVGRKQVPQDDRAYWCSLLYQISEPVLSNMSRGQLRKNMVLELSPNWPEYRNADVAYLETFGRLMAGLAPWLSLPDDNTAEGKMRRQLRQWALDSYRNAVDPESPDYLKWKGENQILCDAAYLAQSFMRAPKALWEPLDATTKKRYVEKFKGLRSIQPAYNNWLLFRVVIESFLASIGEEWDAFTVKVSLHKVDEWYLGDGWYSDGPDVGIDYYNSYVMHPMMVESLEILDKKGIHKSIHFELALRRMQRFNVLLERMISPEGTYPAIGRSITYRLGAFQSLGLAAWKYGLPKSLSYGQVRCALTAVMKRMYSIDGNFNKAGFLQLGFVGHQPNLADYYTNNGSLYMTSLGFLPLGLPADHPFWTAPAEDWTSRKAWTGKPFPKDYHESVRK